MGDQEELNFWIIRLSYLNNHDPYVVIFACKTGISISREQNLLWRSCVFGYRTFIR